jgi:hypothetical protein
VLGTVRANSSDERAAAATASSTSAAQAASLLPPLENGLVGEDVPLSLAPGSAIDGMSAVRFATERKAKSAWALLRQKVRTSIKEFVFPTGM